MTVDFSWTDPGEGDWPDLPTTCRTILALAQEAEREWRVAEMAIPEWA